jgi:O-antigen/teichoic acid export membrane protein
MTPTRTAYDGPPGEHERHLAVGTLAQQAAQVVAVLSMLVVITALGRTLSLEEFGVYGLAFSFSIYLLFVQGGVEAAVIVRLGEAYDADARDRAFSTAMAVYVAVGFVAGALIAAAGIGILQFFDIPAELRDQARLGVVAIGAGTAVGWPMKTYQDVLRGTQRFKLAAGAEACAYIVLATAMLVLLLVVDAPLWILIGLAGSIPLLIGAASAVIVTVQRLRFRFRRHTLDREYTRSFVRFSFYVLAASVTDLIVYSADRAVLAVFRPAAAVGLYEAAVRPHNLVRQLNGSLAQVVLPASARYLADEDEMRVRELLLRGTRYMLAAAVPFTIVFMTLAKPILVAWLGAKFGAAATALTIFVSYWLLNASTSVAAVMLTAAGRVRALAIYAWAIALLNLGLSLTLTPWLGLDGVVLGTTIAYFALSPALFYLTFTTLPVGIGEFARRVWLPAYSLGVALAGLLLSLRFTVGLHSVAAIAAAAITGALTYWGAFYALWMDAEERGFVRRLARRQP